MPIYEYVCETCGEKFERWSTQTRDMDWTELCPHDGGTGKRIMSAPVFVLKEGGVGWAKNGYDGGKSEKPKAAPTNGGNGG